MISLVLAAILATTPAPAQHANLPSEPAQVVQSGGTGDETVFVKNAQYGPRWHRFENLTTVISNYCGPQAEYCEVFCPKSGLGSGGRTCQIVYSCGPRVTKSTEAGSGEMLILDCRKSAIGMKAF